MAPVRPQPPAAPSRPDPREQRPPAPEKTRIAFVDIGRALAAILVVYSHIDWVFLHDRGVTAPVLHWLDTWVWDPMGLGDQGPGGVSVPVFFIVSGFVVTPIAMKMQPGRFAVNRVFRVLPPLWFVLALSVGVVLLGASPLVTGAPDPVTGSKVISNALLYNFLAKPLDAYVAVAWTLIIEMMFYLLLVVLAPVLRRAPWLAIVIEYDLIVAVLLSHHWFGLGGAIAANVAYLIIPIMGQCVWAAANKKMPAWLAGVLMLGGWLLFLWASRAHLDTDYILRPFPIAAAVVLVLAGLFAENKLRQRKGWIALSDRSYSIYLVHGAVAFPVMDLLYQHIPVPLAILAGLAATAVVVELSYRFVEGPSHRLARRLSRRTSG